MTAIPWIAELKEQSSGELSLIFLMVVVGCLTIGFALDLIMKDLGLGPAPNGVLALVGVGAGVYLRYLLLEPFRADDAVMTIAFALGCTLLLLIALAVAKSGALLRRAEKPASASTYSAASPQLRAILKNRRAGRRGVPSRRSLVE